MVKKFILEEAIQNCDSFQGERILLVDDNDLNLKVVKELLEDQGLSVDTAFDGEEALQLFYASSEFSYRVIFLDINMVGLNGYDVARLIRHMGRKDGQIVPIYAMSANILDEHRSKAKQAEMNGYIMKPIDYVQLFGLLHEIFQDQKMDQEKWGGHDDRL